MLRPVLYLVMSLLVFSASLGRAQEDVYYSPADSILYVQVPSPIPYSNYYVLWRFRDGGSRIERTAEDVPPRILTSDNIPGHLFGIHWNGLDPSENYQSTDYGETWALIETLPTRGAGGYGHRPGEIPGQSCMYFQPWLFITSDSWQTYDSLQVNLDSVFFASLSYQINLLYGLAREDDHLLCVSSDTGRTWTVGSHIGLSSSGPRKCGAPDEIWGRLWYRCYVALDTSRTVIDPVFHAHPPYHPYGWHATLEPTNHPGEAYMFFYVEEWGEPLISKIWVYHIQNYGSQVDSFYYRLENHDVVAAENIPHLPERFQLSAYPNPFNASTRITFDLPKAGLVTLKVYDVLGREVTILIDGVRAPGYHSVLFDGSNISSGIYFYRLETGDVYEVRKMVLIR